MYRWSCYRTIQNSGGDLQFAKTIYFRPEIYGVHSSSVLVQLFLSLSVTVRGDTASQCSVKIRGYEAVISLSKSTARRHRASIRSEQAAKIKRDLTSNVRQKNFDGKLLADLGGFRKVNRLAVVLVQDEENKILAICKTSDSTRTMTKQTKWRRLSTTGA